MAEFKIPIKIENMDDLEKAKETAAELVALLKEAKELIRSLSLKDD
jgi:hypothetical protein